MRGICALIQSAYMCIASELCAGVEAFIEIFRSTVSCTSEPSPSFIPLHLRDIKVGGVENTGSSCTLSVLLQEWAAFPEFFDQFLNTTLEKKKDESEQSLQYRINLQASLRFCVGLLRSGQLVEKKDVCQLTKHLGMLGCLNESITPLQLFFHGLFPDLFKLPMTSPKSLYEKVLTLFSDAPNATNQVALLARISSLPLQELFERTSIVENSKNSILFSVAQDYEQEVMLEEMMQVKDRSFTLKLVHACEETLGGKHVVIYRKVGEQWIYISDTRAFLVNELPQRNIYAVVYESRI
jgi:hypothetical protein